MDLLRRVPQQQEVFNLGGRTLTPDLVQELLRDSTVQRQGFALVQNDASWWHSFWRDTPPERILTSPEVCSLHPQGTCSKSAAPRFLLVVNPPPPCALCPFDPLVKRGCLQRHFSFKG